MAFAKMGMGVAVAALLATAVTAQAADWPAKPIRVIVPVAAGSVTDVITRATADKLGPRLGQPLVVDNRGGASGIVGGAECANAAPDGYTICLVYHNTMSYNPLLFSKLPYDADKGFAPIARLYFLTEGLIVPSGLKIGSVAELKAAATKDSGALNFGTLGAGSSPELFLNWLNKQWTTKIGGVPYKGGGPVVQGVVAGEIQLAMIGVGNFVAARDAGTVKVLAVATPKRSPSMPDVPTYAEAGLGDYNAIGWWGIAAPAGTPDAVLERLNAELVKLHNEPDFQAFLEKQAVVNAPTSRADFAAFLKKDRETAAALIALSGTKPVDYTP